MNKFQSNSQTLGHQQPPCNVEEERAVTSFDKTPHAKKESHLKTSKLSFSHKLSQNNVSSFRRPIRPTNGMAPPKSELADLCNPRVPNSFM